MKEGDSQVIKMNVPCSRCGRNLRGHSPVAQCVECGMDVSKSLAVAACRGTDPSDLYQVGRGLNAQVWATLLALAACILGPLFFGGTVSFGILAVVIAVGLSTISAARMLHVRSHSWSGRSKPVTIVMMVVGSASLVLPAVALRLATMKQVPSWIPGVILIGCAAWFMGECAKLHLLEEAAVLAHGRELRQRARNLRRGVAIAAMLVSLTLLPFAMGLLELGRVLNLQFILVAAVSALVLSLLTALLSGRVSVQIHHHALLTSTVRRQIGFTDERMMPDDPDWVVPE